jgi:hypothetical protein
LLLQQQRGRRCCILRRHRQQQQQQQQREVQSCRRQRRRCLGSLQARAIQATLSFVLLFMARSLGFDWLHCSMCLPLCLSSLLQHDARVAFTSCYVMHQSRVRTYSDHRRVLYVSSVQGHGRRHRRRRCQDKQQVHSQPVDCLQLAFNLCELSGVVLCLFQPASVVNRS